MKANITAIVLCAGSGTRTGLGFNKLLYNLNGTTILQTTIKAFLENDNISEIIITTSQNDIDTVKKLLKDYKSKPIQFVLGGNSRFESVKNALNSISNTDYAIIHDGARPFVSQNLINECIRSAIENGSGIACVDCVNSICKKTNNQISEYYDRSSACYIQTPQCFKFEDIKLAYDKATENKFTDDSSVYSEYIGNPFIVKGEIENIKITYAEDLDNSQNYRVGTGYDVHRLVKNRKLILGGISIPHEKGLLGHSDADVLTHAIMDSLLSASNNRDIGFHFPDNDERFKDANSLSLLKEVLEMVSEKFSINNVSAIIICQKPKLSPFIPLMQQSLSETLNLPVDKINILATTNEGLSKIGKGRAIAVSATSILTKHL